MSPADRPDREQHLETELKYRVPAGFVLPSFPSGLTAADRPIRRELAAVYWDTADLRLAREGITLRHRTGEGDADGWHLKLPTAVGGSGPLARNEIHVRGVPGEPPGQLAELVLSRIRGAALQPVASLRTQRTEQGLTDDAGRPVAQIADDVVTADGADLAETAFREIEVEYLRRESRPIRAIDRAMRRAGAVPERSPKLVVVLGASAAAPPEVPAPSRVRRDEPAAAVLEQILRRYVRRLLDADVAARLDSPASIRQLRTATRRLRAVLVAFGPMIRRKWADSLDSDLRWLAGALREARDEEVVRERLVRDLESLPAALVIGPVRRRVAALAGDAGLLRRKAAASLLDDRYLNLLDALVAASRRPQVTRRAAEPAAGALGCVLETARSKLDRAASPVLGGSPTDRDWHRARIAAKELRYAAEALEPFTGKAAGRLGRAAADFQHCLGLHRDAKLAASRVLDSARQGGPGGFTMGLLYAREESAAAAAAAQLPDLVAGIRRVKSPKLRNS